MAPVESSKKAKCFLWLMVWDGLPSSWPEFLWPPPLFTWVFDVFHFCSHVQRVWLTHNRAVLLSETKSFQHEHVSQNCRTFVKKNIAQYCVS